MAVDLASFFSVFVYNLFLGMVEFLIYDISISVNGVTVSWGHFLIACSILSIVIGALISSIRGASLTHEAHLANMRDRDM